MQSRSRGFTLIEMLVIVPVALLVITGFIALMVTMVGNVIAGRASNVMTYDIQSALNTIEQDVRLSTQFQNSSGTLPSPQGKDGAMSAFTSTTGDLVLGEIATNKNPIDPTRSFVYYNAPFGCTDPAEIYKNRIFFITVAYFVKDGSLWRRTYVPSPSGTLCSSQWQVNTCAPGYTSAQTRCQTSDSEILKDVTNFTVSYYTNPQDTVAISSAAADTASSIQVSIQSGKTSAGRAISATSTGRSSKLSDKDITLATPASPVVTGFSADGNATFSWPGVPTATSYIVRYNINGGAWITTSENTTATTFSIAAERGVTVSIKVFARNTTGTSADIASNNASTTTPLWTQCALQNGWTDFGSSYEGCGYTTTSHGVVVLKGLIGGGSIVDGTLLLILPPDQRPTHNLIFQVTISTNKLARLDVASNGHVRVSEIEAGATAGYISLSGITFIPSNSTYSWNALTPINGWTNFGSVYSPLRSTTDASGRVHTQGLLQRNTAAAGSDMANMASGTQPDKVHLFPSRRNGGYNEVGMRPNATMMDRYVTSANTWYSYQTLHYNTAFNGWQSFAFVAGVPGDSQMGNGWVYYNDSGSIHEPPQYTKSADGMVTVKGMIRSGTATSGTVIAKLPAGYRPQGQHIFHLISQTGFARVYVKANGDIEAVVVSSGWTSLDGIHFMASP